MTKSDWQHYLQSHQAQFSTSDELMIESFASTNRPITSFVTPLLYQAILKIVGPDSAKFLQGQVTCDINKATPEQSLLGAACSPQGRMYSSFRVLQNHDKTGYLLRMRSDLLDSTQQTLHKYSVFFKTQLTNTENNWLGLGIWGASCEQLIRDLVKIKDLPQLPGQACTTESILVIRLPGQTPRFECWIQADQITSIWESLQDKAQPASNYLWMQQDIELGIAEVSSAIEGEFNPHMLNFQAIDAISFNKGCYTGQEIVARTHYRGKSKRLMKRFSLSGGTLLATATELHDAAGDKTIATVICAAPTGEDINVQEALLIVSAELDCSSPLLLSQAGQDYQATQLPLPYILD